MDLITKGRTHMTLTPDSVPTVTPVDTGQGPTQGNWTYEDYAVLPDDGKRYEVVNGVLFMSPSPNQRHQDTMGAIFAYLWNHVNLGELGRVYAPLFDVELTPKTICQPDVIVILNANMSKLSAKRIIGAPDLVVEVASPGTAMYDRHEKLEAYAHAGIQEYWIADPTTCTIELRILEAATHYHLIGTFQGAAKIPSQVIPAFSVHVAKLFAFVER